MTETTRKTVSFQMEGEGLTRMMRSWLFDEKKDAEHVIRLLVDLMNNIDVSPKVRERFAEDILLGRAAFDGNTIDGTFGLIRYDPEEQPDVPDRHGTCPGSRTTCRIGRNRPAHRNNLRFLRLI